MSDVLQSFNLTNYRDHPESERHVVFFFMDTETADTFEHLLMENGHEYERDIEGSNSAENEGRHLFAVKRYRLDAIRSLNYTAIGMHRKPIINDPIIKWLVLIVFFTALAVAVIGFVVSGGDH